MATEGISSVTLWNISRRITTSLASAFLEWCLIFMLFIDAIFAFTITKCSHCWKLSTPCPLCSRLDHIFSGKKKGYYWDLICGNHKSEISIFILCHSHSKLVGVQGSRDPSSDIGYKEVKTTSDIEYEGSFSDDDNDVNAKECEANDYESKIIYPGDDLDSGKVMDRDFTNEPLDFLSLEQLNDEQPHVSEFEVSNGLIENGFVELNWQQAESKVDHLAETDLTSDHGVPHHSSTMETSIEVLQESYVPKRGEVGTEREKTGKAEPTPITTSEAGLSAYSVSSDTNQLLPNSLDLGDAYKLAISNKGRQFSATLSEQWMGKDSSRVSEDLKLLFSQLSTTPGAVEHSIHEISPRLSIKSDELQVRQKRFSLERNESSLESLDGSIVSEIDGESLVDRLKRQVEHDKKLMSCLYKELEEERNASAIAVNQAMAMITKLQEEKATLHMEALQCLRMMEEQSEYDNEALRKSNDLLAEKEKEVQDLEAELEFYRNKYQNES